LNLLFESVVDWFLDTELGASYVLLAEARSAFFNLVGDGAKRHTKITPGAEPEGCNCLGNKIPTETGA
jgi:hypothetical protein